MHGTSMTTDEVQQPYHTNSFTTSNVYGWSKEPHKKPFRYKLPHP